MQQAQQSMQQMQAQQQQQTQSQSQSQSQHQQQGQPPLSHSSQPQPPSSTSSPYPSLPSSSSSQAPNSAPRPQPTKEQLVLLFKEKLVQSGEKARLKALLNSRLTEVQWKVAIVDHCRAVIQKQGLDKVTVDQLVQQSSQLGRDTVPQHVKLEMLEQIRKSLSKVQRGGA